jgi:hypothetical protein
MCVFVKQLSLMYYGFHVIWADEVALQAMEGISEFSLRKERQTNRYLDLF